MNTLLVALLLAASGQKTGQPVEADVSNRKVTATGSTTARALKDRAADVVNVKDFGAKGDGVTDDTAAIAAAYAALGAAGGEIRFPAGTYKFNLLIAKGGVFLAGAGNGYGTSIGTRFIPANTAAPVIQFGDGITQIVTGGISRVNIVGLGETGYPTGDGLVVNGARNLFFSDMSVLLFGRYAVHVTSGAGGVYTEDCFFEKVVIRRAGDTALRIDTAASPSYTTGIDFSNAILGTPSVAGAWTLKIDGTGSAYRTDVAFANTWIGTQNGSGVLLAGGGTIYGVNTHIDSDVSTDTLVQITTVGTQHIEDAIRGDITIDGKVKFPDNSLSAQMSSSTHYAWYPRLGTPYLNQYLSFGDMASSGDPEGPMAVPQVTLFRKNANGSGLEVTQQNGSSFRVEGTYARPLQTGSVGPASSVGTTGGAIWRNGSTGDLYYKGSSIWPASDVDGVPLSMSPAHYVTTVASGVPTSTPYVLGRVHYPYPGGGTLVDVIITQFGAGTGGTSYTINVQHGASAVSMLTTLGVQTQASGAYKTADARGNVSLPSGWTRTVVKTDASADVTEGEGIEIVYTETGTYSPRPSVTVTLVFTPKQ